MSSLDSPAFSRPVVVEHLPDRESRQRFEADDAERASLAARFDVNAVDALKAEVRLKPISKRGIHVDGDFDVRVRQTCVVTLDEMENRVTGRFQRDFYPQPFEEKEETAHSLETFDDTSPDPTDPIVNGVIDLGDVLAEEIALAIDPFPRKKGAVFEGGGGAEGDEPAPEEKTNPFAQLAALKDKLGKSD